MQIIFISWQEAKKTNKQYAIQVKTTTKKTWLLSKKAEILIASDTFYVFVKIQGNNHPEYYIYSSEYVAKTVREYHILWLHSPGKNGREHKDNPMREFIDLTNKDRWDLIEQCVLIFKELYNKIVKRIK